MTESRKDSFFLESLRARDCAHPKFDRGRRTLTPDQSRQGHPLKIVPTLRRCYYSCRQPSCISSFLVGLGREGTKLAARLKLGKTAAADPSVFVDWKSRLLAMGRAEARRLGLPWNRVGGWKRTVRRTGTLRGDALRRLKRALIGSGCARRGPSRGGGGDRAILG